MADVHSKETRSYNMSRIKGMDKKPEMLVRKFLHANGFRYRLHEKIFPVSLKLFYLNTRLSFLFMDVFGMDMKDVNIWLCKRPN